MRRKDREVTDPAEIEAILRRCEVCRLALNDPETGAPYILPLNFGFERQAGRLVLYFHGAAAGRKHQLIAADPRAAFEMDCGHELILDQESGNCSMAYESVIGTGTIGPVPDVERPAALRALMCQYRSEGFAYNPAVLPVTAFLKLTVERLTAKRRPKPGA